MNLVFGGAGLNKLILFLDFVVRLRILVDRGGVEVVNVVEVFGLALRSRTRRVESLVDAREQHAKFGAGRLLVGAQTVAPSSRYRNRSSPLR